MTTPTIPQFEMQCNGQIVIAAAGPLPAKLRRAIPLLAKEGVLELKVTTVWWEPTEKFGGRWVREVTLHHPKLGAGMTLGEIKEGKRGGLEAHPYWNYNWATFSRKVRESFVKPMSLDADGRRAIVKIINHIPLLLERGIIEVEFTPTCRISNVPLEGTEIDQGFKAGARFPSQGGTSQKKGSDDPFAFLDDEEEPKTSKKKKDPCAFLDDEPEKGSSKKKKKKKSDDEEDYHFEEYEDDVMGEHFGGENPRWRRTYHAEPKAPRPPLPAPEKMKTVKLEDPSDPPMSQESFNLEELRLKREILAMELRLAELRVGGHSPTQEAPVAAAAAMEEDPEVEEDPSPKGPPMSFGEPQRIPAPKKKRGKRGGRKNRRRN